MKSLFRIVKRYILSAVVVMLFLLLFNFALYAFTVWHYSMETNHLAKISDIAKELSVSKDRYQVSEYGKQMLKDYRFAMLIDEKGSVVWSYNLPKELKKQYSIADVAGFSKWYLKDYPVTEWILGNQLLVVGQEKDSVWKGSLLLDYGIASNSPSIAAGILLGNVILIFLLCMFLGVRLYIAFKPVVEGIEGIAKGNVIHLKESGITKDILQKLNQTACLLEKQKAFIEKRDLARTEWIAGVSHDIRTPLSMVLGYAQAFQVEETLSTEQKKQAQIMVSQSLKMKQLIEDLNLTSKLEYQMQPLKKESYRPEVLLRQIIADYYNSGLCDVYSIELNVDSNLKEHNYYGDVKLIARVFDNLIGNGIRHNDGGCEMKIFLSYDTQKEKLQIIYQDNGTGIPQEVLDELDEKITEDAKKPHIMGLRIAKQIILAHDGTMRILSNKGNLRIEMYL